MIMRTLYKYLALLSVILFFSTKSQAQSLPITSYGVWDRGGGIPDYSSPNADFVKGIETTLDWKDIQAGPGTNCDFSAFQTILDVAVANDKLIRFSVNVGPDCPLWVFDNGVPLVNVISNAPKNDAYANRNPYYPDPEYKAYYFEMIRQFALFLRNQPQEKFDHIAFVQVKTGATGDEEPYKGTVTDGTNGTVDNTQYGLSKTQWEAFRLEAFAKFKENFNDVPNRKIVLTFNNVDPVAEPDAYNYVMTQLDPVLGFGLKGGAYNRGHHLSDEQTYKEQWNPFLINPKIGPGNPNGVKLFSASEMDQSWNKGYFALNYEIGFYWSALGGINTGLSCTNVSVSAMTYALANPGIIDIFKMYNRYAQQVYPATATTAFSVFHEGLNSADKVKFPESIYGTARQPNLTRYQAICNDPKYASRGARIDDTAAVVKGQVFQRESQEFYNDAGWDICEGNIERFMTQINPDATSIGLFRVRGTITATSSKYDRFARSFENSTGRNTMYFQLHTELPVNNKTLKFTIIWLDKTAGSTWAFKYRNVAGLQTIPYTGTGTNEWRTETFNISDAVMNQGGVNGSDFMLVNTDTTDDIFNGIEMNILQDQTINFNALPSKKVGDADFSPGATASSGLAVTYTSSNTNVATIVGNNIRIIGSGACTITASQAGDNSYSLASSVSQYFSVAVETQTTITTSGTWICPAGINTIKVEAWGAGGSGGSTSSGGVGGGGAGGSYVINQNIVVIPSSIYTVTVGAGGVASISGSANGTAGGSSQFSSTIPVIANGDVIGANATGTGAINTAFGLGGINTVGGSGGTVTIGGSGADAATSSGGKGGDGAGPNGGVGGASDTVASGSGNPGSSPGGGGSGAFGSSGGNRAGGAGGAGQIIITYTVGVPNAPTIGTATVLGASGQASIPFTAPAFNGNSTITTYTATSSPGGITATLSQAGSGTIIMNGLTNGTAYTFTITATNVVGQSTASAASNAVTPNSSSTWDGAAWSNETPTASVDAIIAGNYSVAASITAKTLTINNNAIVTIPSGSNVTVTGAVMVTAPATLTLSNNANLIQLNNTTNTGVITVKRNSNPLFRLDYTMWSSPVSGTQTLAQFSPLTSQSPNRFFTYNSATILYATVSPSIPFSKGSGYLIRMPNTDPTPNYDGGTATLTYNGEFTGVPNNGTINVTTVPNKYNAVGNPYPSVINAELFKISNADINTLYFWRKTNNLNQGTTPTTSYATYNIATDTGIGVAPDGAAIGQPTVTPDKYIQVGQGFLFTTAQSSIVFNNEMRVANNGNKILKTKQVEKSRIWLNLSNPNWPINQIALCYVEGAIQGVDESDSKYFNDSQTALNSLINNEEYIIQGRPAFDASDVVPLAFKTTATDNYTIALDHFDGVFAAGQDVYLVDSKTGTETNLKTGSYIFNATVGVDNTRFSLKYQKTLKVDAPVFNENSVRVYKNNSTLYVNSGNVAISNIAVFDIQGRLIAEQKSVKATTATIHNLKAINQVLIVKIIAENNQEVIKKIVN
jgi:hypothetical protein